MYKGSLLFGFAAMSHFPKPMCHAYSCAEAERGDMHMAKGRSVQRIFVKVDFFIVAPPQRFKTMETSIFTTSKNRMSLTTVKSAAMISEGMKRISHAVMFITILCAFFI